MHFELNVRTIQDMVNKALHEAFCSDADRDLRNLSCEAYGVCQLQSMPT